eukprot:m.18203 g.18203  ORF g.18203 m.18203 type:complete len:93 (+) comp7718_c0_seq1:103-381(+)
MAPPGQPDSSKGTIQHTEMNQRVGDMPGASTENPKDCLQCRIVGSVALLISGVYLIQTSKRPNAPELTRTYRTVLKVIGTGFLGLSVLRATM